MSTRTQITTALTILGLSASAYAAYPMEEMPAPMPMSNDIHLTAPYQAGMWTFAGEGLYFEPDTEFHYATQVTNDTDTTSDITSNYRVWTVDPDYDWGFRGEIAYHFTGNGRDVMLGYTRLHHSESERRSIDLADYLFGSVTTDSVNYFAPPVLASGEPLNGNIFATDFNSPDGATDGYNIVEGRSENDYDAIDLVFGQKIDVGQRIRLHPFAGLRYAEIERTDRATYSLQSTTAGSTFTNYIATSRFHSDFSGLGPRLGSDAAVNLGGGFGLTGRLGVSLLVGDLDQKITSTYESYNTAGGAATLESLASAEAKIPSKTRVIPEADARLGVHYAFDFNEGSSFGIELGYEVTNYFNAIDVSQASVIDNTSHNNDFNLQGPYLRLQLDIA